MRGTTLPVSGGAGGSSSSGNNTNNTSSSSRSRPGSSNRPNHIALPANSTTTNGFSRSGPGTPSSPGAAGLTGPGVTTPRRETSNQPLGSPSSPRSSFLPSFMQRNRPRSSTLNRMGSQNQVPTLGSVVSAAGGGGGGSGPGGGNANLARSVSTPTGGGESSAGPSAPLANGSTSPTDTTSPSSQTYRIRLVPHLETYRSLHFEPVVRDLKPCTDPENSDGRGTILRIGRFTEKPAVMAGEALPEAVGVVGAGAGTGSGNVPAPAAAGGGGEGGGEQDDAAVVGGGGAGSTNLLPLGSDRIGAGAGGGGALTSHKVAFKSKVVSRGHAELYVLTGGQFYIRDTKSSSGTFLNHIRLSNPSQESRPFAIKDGDVIQLGVDYQGGTEEMFRCVKMKVEAGREKRNANFNKEAMKQLKALGGVPDSPTNAATPSKKTVAKASVTDCCICLFSVTVQQALFIAPCSHVFHFKCIRPMIETHYPGFNCPLCRSFHDLNADVETEDAWDVASRRASVRRESVVPPSRQDSLPSVQGAPIADADEDQAMDPAINVADDEAGENGNVSGSGNDHDSEAQEVAMDGSHSVGSLSEAASSPSRRPQMSLGALPIPRMDQPSHGNNPDYASLDAATPMNHTFLSTLADGFNNPPVPVEDNSQQRRSLENVQEDDEMRGGGDGADEVGAEGMDIDDEERRRRVDGMYT